MQEEAKLRYLLNKSNELQQTDEHDLLKIAVENAVPIFTKRHYGLRNKYDFVDLACGIDERYNGEHVHIKSIKLVVDASVFSQQNKKNSNSFFCCSFSSTLNNVYYQTFCVTIRQFLTFFQFIDCVTKIDDDKYCFEISKLFAFPIPYLAHMRISGPYDYIECEYITLPFVIGVVKSIGFFTHFESGNTVRYLPTMVAWSCGTVAVRYYPKCIVIPEIQKYKHVIEKHLTSSTTLFINEISYTIIPNTCSVSFRNLNNSNILEYLFEDDPHESTMKLDDTTSCPFYNNTDAIIWIINQTIDIV